MTAETTVTPVETLTTELAPLKRYEMPPDRVEVRLSDETLDMRVEVSVEGPRSDTRALKRGAQAGLDATLASA